MVRFEGRILAENLLPNILDITTGIIYRSGFIHFILFS